MATGIYFANGTASEPNEAAICMLERSRDDCLRIQIKKDGTYGRPEIYSSGFAALPDGMAFDVDRNLFITLPGVARNGRLEPINMVLRVDTNRNWTELIDDPKGSRLSFPTNCAFGVPDMQTLYLGNLEGDHMDQGRTPLRGHPLYPQS